jgi:hypothetical protein
MAITKRARPSKGKGRVLAPPRTGRLKSLWSANEIAPFAVTLPTPRPPKFGRIEDIPPFPSNDGFSACSRTCQHLPPWITQTQPSHRALPSYVSLLIRRNGKKVLDRNSVATSIPLRFVLMRRLWRMPRGQHQIQEAPTGDQAKTLSQNCLAE